MELLIEVRRLWVLMPSRRPVLQMGSRDSWKFEVDLRIVGFQGVCVEARML